jgi:hypothetical protein
MRRPDLVPDCGSCDALCCVATSFEASEDFAVDKSAGVRCPHLTSEHKCSIHDKLIDRGFLGCVLYDCYGAGPTITRRFAGTHAELQRNSAFNALRTVHELLWQLTEAAKLCPAARADIATEIAREIERLDAIAQGPTSALIALDLTAREAAARASLRRVGEALGGRRPAAHLPVLARD